MRRTLAERKAMFSGATTRVLNLVRRTAAVGSSSATRWLLSGLTGIDGEIEAFDRAEVFGSAGVAARPPDGGADVIVATVGRMQIVVSSRSKGGRPTLERDETAVYNTLRAVLVNKLGQVLLGKAAVDALIKGTTYRSAEDTMLTALALGFTAAASAWSAMAADTSLVALAATKTAMGAAATAATAAATAITTFQAGAATYLSTISKTE